MNLAEEILELTGVCEAWNKQNRVIESALERAFGNPEDEPEHKPKEKSQEPRAGEDCDDDELAGSPKKENDLPF